MKSTLFSQKLIQETINCFKEEDGLDVSPEQANEYLHSLAGLYLAFVKKRPVPAEAVSSAGGTLPVDTHARCLLGVSNTQ